MTVRGDALAGGMHRDPVAVARAGAATAVAWLRSARLTLGLIGAMLAVWCLEHDLIGTTHNGRVLGYLAFGALPNAPIAGRGSPDQWWRYISSAFAHDHQTLLHVGANALALLVVAPSVERLYGRLVLLATLVLGSAAGGVTWLWISSIGLADVPDYTGGISAGICALLGLLLAYGYRHRSSVAAEVQANIRARAAMGVSLVVLAGLVIPSLNNWAHAGGFAAGVVIGAAATPQGEGQGSGDRRVRAVLWCVIAAAIAALVLAGLNLAHRLA